MTNLIEVQKILLGLCLALFSTLGGCPAARQPEEAPVGNHQALATFAGGCFWCLEPPFESLPGVTDVVVGYAGGSGSKPVEQEVAAGRSDYAETVQVHYNPRRISYEELLKTFWMQIDPEDTGGQFIERGAQYRTIIFYHTSEQQAAATRMKSLLAASGCFKRGIATEIKPYTAFWTAEEVQQNFYLKHSPFYKLYRRDSGREKYLNEVWGEKQIWEKLKDKEKNANRHAQALCGL
jgi:peptide methionine sulfoxide reductase msrA/msrB